MTQSRIPLRLALALGGALVLAGCETANPVQVTRFHLAQPIAPGSFSIESTPAMGPGSPVAPDSIELNTYSDIVAGELTHLGFTRADGPGNSELSVSVLVDRGTRPDYNAGGASISFGIGGASFGRHSSVGGGVGTGFDLGGGNSGASAATIEVFMGKGPKPVGVDVYDAHAVRSTLGRPA